jgi:hypothetical protein
MLGTPDIFVIIRINVFRTALLTALAKRTPNQEFAKAEIEGALLTALAARTPNQEFAKAEIEGARMLYLSGKSRAA